MLKRTYRDGHIKKVDNNNNNKKNMKKVVENNNLISYKEIKLESLKFRE